MDERIAYCLNDFIKIYGKEHKHFNTAQAYFNYGHKLYYDETNDELYIYHPVKNLLFEDDTLIGIIMDKEVYKKG